MNTPNANSLPRRIQVDKWSAAEKKIQAAVDAVEAMPADPRLTDAVVLLGQARGRVADYVDGIPDEPELADMPIVIRHDGDPIPEDELPEGYPYSEMFPFSWVDITRQFPSLEFVRGYLARTSRLFDKAKEPKP